MYLFAILWISAPSSFYFYCLVVWYVKDMKLINYYRQSIAIIIVDDITDMVEEYEYRYQLYGLSLESLLLLTSYYTLN